jgi:hypothetical protein
MLRGGGTGVVWAPHGADGAGLGRLAALAGAEVGLRELSEVGLERPNAGLDRTLR